MPTQENIADSTKRLSAYKNKGKDSDVSSLYACLSIYVIRPKIAYLISGAGL